MYWREIKLGLCPIGKFVFSHEDACRYKEMIRSRLDEWGVRYVDLEGVIADGMVRDQQHVEPAVGYFRDQQIDAVFMPHCNFGTEGAVGMIGKKIAKPVLLWGPRDEAPLADGTRLRDTLCGLFASSKVLSKLAVPFTYIENCRIDDPQFKTGLIDFLRTAAVVKAFRTMRIGQVGGRIDFFWTTKVNESELQERFGIEIVPIDLVRVVRRVRQLADDRTEQYRRELDRLGKDFVLEGYPADEPLINMLALRDFYLEWAEEEKLSALCVETFPSLRDELGSYDTLAAALASDAGVPIVCETDVHGAISVVMLEAAAIEPRSAFFADLTIRHPGNDNAILLWHCAAPASSACDDRPPKIAPHWILPSPISGVGHWRLKDGPMTVARFDGDGGDYRLIAGTGQTTEGPFTQNCYAWFEVSDWPKWERAFIEGPYIHHVAVIHDQSARVLLESCKYIPSLTADVVLVQGPSSDL